MQRSKTALENENSKREGGRLSVSSVCALLSRHNSSCAALCVCCASPAATCLMVRRIEGRLSAVMIMQRKGQDAIWHFLWQKSLPASPSFYPHDISLTEFSPCLVVLLPKPTTPCVLVTAGAKWVGLLIVNIFTQETLWELKSWPSFSTSRVGELNTNQDVFSNGFSGASLGHLSLSSKNKTATDWELKFFLFFLFIFLSGS